MELHDAVIYGFPYKLRPKPKIAVETALELASFPGLPRLRFLIACSMQKLSQKARAPGESYHVIMPRASRFVTLYICMAVLRRILRSVLATKTRQAPKDNI